MISYLDGSSVRAALNWDDLTPAMETPLARFSTGRVIQSMRHVLIIEKCKRYLGIMPAVAEIATGAKLVNFFPGNAGTGVPTHLAKSCSFGWTPVNH